MTCMNLTLCLHALSLATETTHHASCRVTMSLRVSSARCYSSRASLNRSANSNADEATMRIAMRDQLQPSQTSDQATQQSQAKRLVTHSSGQVRWMTLCPNWSMAAVVGIIFAPFSERVGWAVLNVKHRCDVETMRAPTRQQ